MPRARVLAVDDQRYFRELIEGLLREEGFEVRTASCGDEALHILERQDFDVVVTDLVMPGMDGTELVSRIKKRDAEQPVVMVTGVVDVQTAVAAMKQGATDYILKPFDRDALLSSLDGILQRRRLRDEHARLMAENLEYLEVMSLYERATSLFSSLSLEPLVERIIEGLCLETRAQGGVMWVAGTIGERALALAGARGIVRVEEEPEELAVERLGTEFTPLVEHGCSVVASASRNGSGDPALYVPLRHAGHLLGLARLSDRLEGGSFGDRDRAAAEKFAALGGTALANALRFRALERSSFRDPITRAYTHSYFRDVVRNEIQKADRFSRTFSLLRIEVEGLAEARRERSASQVTRWLEELGQRIGAQLRSTDLLAAESECRFSVLLPETDGLAAALLRMRIVEALQGSVDGTSDGRGAPRVAASAAVTYPDDGAQLESLERGLDRRLDEDRNSPVRRLALGERSFAQALECLAAEAAREPAAHVARAARFAIAELGRRTRERRLLFVSPGAALREAVCAEVERLDAATAPTDVVVLTRSQDGPLPAGPFTRVSTERIGTDRPFLLTCGDGPAYALVAGRETGRDDLAFFHSADRALVEHLTFQLQRDLGIPLGS